ncbi:MAG: hypothetical protein HC813_03075 [Planctomycetes bacterium]|nr:hypothetical protein [Planctomycetota bacterium]
MVSREVYEAARETAEKRSAEIGELRTSESEARARVEELRTSLGVGERVAAEQKAAREAADRQVADLRRELEGKEAQLKNYLSVKDLADSAGSIQLQNMQLQREVNDLRGRLSASESEREGLYAMLAKQKIEERQGDPEAIKKAAEEMGVLPPSPEKGAPAVMSSRDKRKIRMQLNRLLGQAPGEEIYEILDFGDLAEDGALRDVKVGRYLNQQMLNSLVCRELEIVCLKERDTVELRFKEGAIVNTRNPSEKIPFAEGVHSVFVEKLGLATWLEEAARNAVIAPDGRLTFRS